MGDKKTKKSTFLARRRILTTLACAPLLSVSGRSFALSANTLSHGIKTSDRASHFESRELTFSHTHTGEKLNVTYFEKGRYLPDALNEINYLLRDFRTAEIIDIDPQLLDMVHRVKKLTDSKGTLQIISGYRSPATNELLRQTTSGVAKKSYHMQGQAIDIRLTDVSTRKLRDAATSLAMGGVGYYQASDFLHLDLGPVRFW